MAVGDKPRLIYESAVVRGQHRRRLMWFMLLLVVVTAAYWALTEAARRGLVAGIWLDVGRLAAILLGGLLGVRALYHLVNWLARRSEAVRVFDKGIAWTRGGTTHKFGWSQLVSYREGARGIYLAEAFPVLRWGAHTLTFRDGTALRFTHRLGDPRRFAGAVRPLAARATGERIGHMLRQDRPVKLHKDLIVYPGGIASGKTEIPWEDLDVRLSGGQLIIRRKDATGRFVRVRTYARHRVNNVGGFLDVVAGTLTLYQPERTGKAARQRAS